MHYLNKLQDNKEYAIINLHFSNMLIRGRYRAKVHF